MKSLVPKYLWLLSLLLLLLPLKLQGDYWDYYEYELNPKLRDYLRELHSTGPTKPPNRERIIERIIADPERPFIGNEYCNSEIRVKNIHNKFRCCHEHYFLSVTFEELLKACYGEQVVCKNEAGYCRRSTTLVDGVKCTLESGNDMSQCTYTSVFMTGYAVVNCQWDDDFDDLIPNTVHNILLPTEVES